MRYAVVIEQGENNYSAYVPDLPGCVSVGDTLDEVKSEIREAIAFHLDGMREDGLPIPAPRSYADNVDVAVPAQNEAARSRDAKSSASAHVGKVRSPDSLAPHSGIYEQVRPRGGQTGAQSDSMRGRALPPTAKPSADWEIMREARGPDLGSERKRGRRKEV
jgi:predicted RNase H-like HicB family nuclease